MGRSLSLWERAARQPQADAPGEGHKIRRDLNPHPTLSLRERVDHRLLSFII